ncbi:MAG TPA: peptide ABC transporter substrate-binding protein [Candidatus Bipolaricaulis sp.]|nr:peptide ABC transporter substrate-binding protein [Candidatus Bipolaricaulis sp.]HRS13399.1 peptide ABC transporter substrate-binding protein [Candidatus Bipolaricaulis sp.]HRU22171.1 peptide ABC transporter substrate-binding protein [Candidatus Bipolaricaulis sp.]
MRLSKLAVVLLVSLMVWPVMGQVIMNRNLGTEPPSADPAISTDTTSIEIIEHMFLGLVDLDEVTMAPVPELATSWDVSEDGLTWTYHLRNDVYWVRYDTAVNRVLQETATLPDNAKSILSEPDRELFVGKDADGNNYVVAQRADASGFFRLVSAYDVEYGVKRTLNPKTASDYSYVLYIIQGAYEANTADPTSPDFPALMDAIGVKALDAFTVQFTLIAPAGYFGQIASMWIARPQPKWAIDAYGDSWTEPGNIVTNGSYAMKSWIHNDSMVFVRNPYLPDDLWGGGNIDEVHCVMIVEESTAFAMYLNNELDTGGVPLSEMDRVKADPVLSKELTIRPFPCTYYYGFITTKAPTNDVRVRKALSMTIDRQTLIDQVTKGEQLPANTFAGGSIFGNAALDPRIAPWALPEKLGGWGYDKALTEAQKLMAEAGYPDGAGLEIILMHNSGQGHAVIAQAVQAMWAKAFPKARFTIEVQEWKVYLTTISKETPVENMPNVYRLGWCQDYPDQNNWVHEVFNPTYGNNDPRMSPDDPQVGAAVAEFDRLTTLAGRLSDPEERQRLYFEAERLLCDEIVAIAPIYYYTQIALTKPWLTRHWHDTPHWDTWSIDAKLRAQMTGKG